MGGTKEGEGRHRTAVAVVDDEVPNTWQQLDLDFMLASLPRPSAGAAGTLVTPAVSSVSHFHGGGRKPNPSVPGWAFVSIGRRGKASVPRVQSRRGAPGRSANDNVAAGESRSVWRDLFFLMVLAATVAGAFWSGRVHGLQKVIVVPAPSSFYSVIT
jgi:hypothetical protein